MISISHPLQRLLRRRLRQALPSRRISRILWRTRFRAGTNPRTLLTLIPNTPMKRILFSLLALFALAACSQNDVEEASADRYFKADHITVGFENDDTRIQLYNGKSVWNAEDRVSVFYRSFDNLKWVFLGEDGDRNGELELEEGTIGKQVMNDIVVVYPYSENYLLNLSTRTVEAQVSAQQNYLADSYDPASNLMIACNEDRNFVLKNVFGWLKVELTGEGQNVQKLTLRGNDGEILAGYVAVAFDDAAAEFVGTSLAEPDNDNEVGGSLDFSSSSSDSITLRCSGVELSSEACAFYIALVPQTFEKGITVEVKCRGYEPMVLSTDDAVEIKRNHIKPMAVVEFEAEESNETDVPNNEIWYTATEQIWPNYVDDFDAALVDNYYNSATGEGVLVFDGELTRIANWSFEYMYSLTSVTLPNGILDISYGAFMGCDNLQNVVIPDSVEVINHQAFCGCRSLCEIKLPENLRIVGYAAFGSCGFKSVNIPSGIEEFNVEVFGACGNLERFEGDLVSEDGRCVVINETLYSFAPAGLTSYTTPAGVKKIEFRAFIYCGNLEEITVSDGVEMITDEAFSSCASLRKVTIADSVEQFGNGVFWGCPSLEEVDYKYVSEDGRSVVIDGRLIAAATAGLSEYVIPEEATIIGSYALSANDITSIILHDNIYVIEDFGFESCMFSSITLPANLTYLGYGAFNYCLNLSDVYCTATTPPSMGGMLFGYNSQNRNIYVPLESLEDYKTADGWREFASCIIGYDSETGETVMPTINLGICGTITDWGDSGIPDIAMEYLEERNLYVAYGVELTIDDRFKLRADNTWQGLYNIGLSWENNGRSVSVNSAIQLVNSPDSQDIFIAAGGRFDIYINLDTMTLYFMASGVDPDEAILKGDSIGLCGTMNDWGSYLDLEMTYLEDRGLWAYYGIELDVDDEFKLRWNNNWDRHYGRYSYDAISPNSYALLQDGSSENLRVSQWGCYDIYFDEDARLMYVMESGVDPDEAVEDSEDVNNEEMWVSMGYGKYMDDFFWVVVDDASLAGNMAEVEFQQHASNPNRIRVVNPLSADVIYQLYGVVPDWYWWNGVDTYLEFDISDPSNVQLVNTTFSLGFQLNFGEWREMYFVSLYRDNIKLENGIISFTPQSVGFCYFDNGELTGWYANQYGMLQYALPGYEFKDYRFSAEYVGSDENNIAYFDMKVGKDIDKYAVAVVEGDANADIVVQAIIDGTAENIIEFSGDQTDVNIELAPGLYTLVVVAYSNGEPVNSLSIVFFHEGDGSFEALELDVEFKVDIVANFFPEDWEAFNEQYPGWYCFGFTVTADRPGYVRSVRVANCAYDEAHIDGAEISNQRIEEILAKYGVTYPGNMAQGGVYAHVLKSSIRECIVMAIDTYYKTTQYYHLDYDVPAQPEARGAATYATLKSVVYNEKAATKSSVKQNSMLTSKPNLSNIVRF